MAGITYLPWIWASIRLRRYIVLHKAHRNTLVIRIGPTALSFNDPRAAQAIYGHSSVAIKDTYYDSGAAAHRHLADTRDKAEHSRKRRILSAGYALTTVVRWEDKVVSRIQALLNQYDKHCPQANEPFQSDTTSLDHRRWMNLFTIDIINDIGLSANLRLLKKGDDLI
ncbi:hypothetical protein V502_07863 [Pseudogymnoascus sp. VKM F-4520 (FW-2644)]|nr:hypothetical protein V502_07863 [Pseudogymnoascus sp. VKM F-4520 (FW-2644)]